MATQNPQIVPIAFQSQQIPFFFGGSQVPIDLTTTTYIDLTQPKRRKLQHNPEIINLVDDDIYGNHFIPRNRPPRRKFYIPPDSSDSDEEPIVVIAKSKSKILPPLTPLEMRQMEQAMRDADEADYREIQRRNEELKRKLGFIKY